jgi:hypothetical protein
LGTDHAVGSGDDFEDGFLEEYPSHLEVGVCDTPAGVAVGDEGVGHILGPLNAPNYRLQGSVAAKPHAASSESTCVAVPNVVKLFLHELAYVGRSARKIPNDNDEI